MEDVPPSYDSAVSRDPWAIVAPFILSADLCSAALVSRNWHSIVNPLLWGSPTSHFGTDNDAVYIALTRFRRILRRARQEVRDLTHTLHLPPALSEIYGGPNSLWLRDVLEYLPNLQSLIVSRLPFFDHHSLIALRHPSPASRDGLPTGDDGTFYDLKLLLAEREPNTTSAGIREALLHFPKLVYLDLSYTTPARDSSVLSSLAGLWDLQVLKLRGVGLRDHELSVLAEAVGIRVRILDIRDNQLTDAAVHSLIHACFLATERSRGERVEDDGQNGDWPIGIPPGPDFLSLDSLRSEDLDRQLLRQLTHPLTGRLAFEDLPHKGLTHLFISGNSISYAALVELTKTRRLHVLDAGSNPILDNKPHHDSFSNTVSTSNPRELCAALVEDAKATLTHLRVHYSVFLEGFLVFDDSKTPASKSTLKATELDSKQSAIFEVPAPARYAVELPTENDPVFELSGESASNGGQRGYAAQPLGPPPPIDQPPVPQYALIEDESSTRAKSGDGAYAPEPVPTSDLEPAVSQQPKRFSTSNNNDQNSTHRLGAITTQIDELLAKRPSNKIIHPSSSFIDTSLGSSRASLHPSHLPHLRTLILTNVPAQDHESLKVSQMLINFITACAEETHLAELQQKIHFLSQPTHGQWPANRRAQPGFALHTIVLEIDSPKQSVGGSGKAWDHSHARLNTLRSSTGDVDSEALWTAAENDFSFFGEEGEEEIECGICPNEPDKHYPTAAQTNEKIIYDPTTDIPPTTLPSQRTPFLTPSPIILQSPRNLPLGRNRRSSTSPRQSPLTPSSSSPRTTLPSQHPPAVDIVAELSAFRRARKAAHEAALASWRAQTRTARGVVDMGEPYTPGHWKGAIKIVRNAAPRGRSGVVDSYGNFFEKGYLYP